MNGIPWPETIDEWAMVAGSLMAIASMVYYDIFGLRDRGEPVEPDVRSDPETAPATPFPTFEEPQQQRPPWADIGLEAWLRGDDQPLANTIASMDRQIEQLLGRHASLVRVDPHGDEILKVERLLEEIVQQRSETLTSRPFSDALVMERHRREQEVLHGYGLRTLAEREAQEEIDELVGDGGVVWSSHPPFHISQDYTWRSERVDPHANRRIRPALNPGLIGKDRR